MGRTRSRIRVCRSPTLCAHAEGLIVLTGGPEGPVGRLLLEGRREAAMELVAQLQEAFADRLYVELLRHGLESEAATEPALLAIARQAGLPIVATNDAYFATPDMYEAHDALLCISQGTHLADTNRRRLTPEHSFKSGAEMRAVFSDLPDAIANTGLIARRCAFAIDSVRPMLPPYDCGEGVTEEEALRQAARRGLQARLAALAALPEAEPRRHQDREYLERLEYELEVICKMGFAGYFLIVAEFIGWAKERGIPVGPGRGSGAGSVAAWALGITDLDPLRFGLLFERFLNPERVSMPDFDIDFCQDRRDEVIRHVQQKYGHDRVAQIITFGKLQARAVLRDVGRVMGLPYGQVDKICKLVPNNPANPVSLDGALKAEPQLQTMVAEDETVSRLIDIARRLEGLYRHASTHAAGVVISDRPLMDSIPLYRDPRSELLVTGFNMKWVEAAGLVKFDFLGLKTLTVLSHTVELVRGGRGEAIDLGHLPLNDRPTFELLGRGDTVGVFQLESAGMRDVLRKLKPDTFEDIIAVVALYRPGPMDNIPSYIRRKHGEEQADYLYPTLQDILRETYGIMIYQEQVMQIAQELSGYSLGGADLLRRAMGKKIKQEMDQQRASFISGAVARGVPEAKASQVFELVSKFAGYGFNKSHAAAYALIAYQTAYLKANYPLEFFAASMTLDLANSDKLNGFRQELGRLGIRLLPPDINASESIFSVEHDGPSGAGGIRYALAGVKTVGEPAARAVVDERRRGGPFTSLADFARRLDPHYLNKRQIENLARAGAFDSLNANRRQVFDSAEAIARCAAASTADRASEQIGLFGASGFQPPRLQLADVQDWPPMERLSEELEAVGFYLSSHPLDTYGPKLKRLKIIRYGDLLASGQSGPATLAGHGDLAQGADLGQGQQVRVRPALRHVGRVRGDGVFRTAGLGARQAGAGVLAAAARQRAGRGRLRALRGAAYRVAGRGDGAPRRRHRHLFRFRGAIAGHPRGARRRRCRARADQADPLARRLPRGRDRAARPPTASARRCSANSAPSPASATSGRCRVGGAKRYPPLRAQKRTKVEFAPLIPPYDADTHQYRCLKRSDMMNRCMKGLLRTRFMRSQYIARATGSLQSFGMS